VFWSADAREALLGELDEQVREASRAQRYERAAGLVRRKERLDRLLWRTEGMLEAMHARPRLVLASHPSKPRWDGFWVVGGRVVDWGALPADSEEIATRTEAAMREAAASARPGSAAAVPAAEVDEVRIVASWVARNEPPALEIGDPAEAASWALATAAPEAVALAG
jgi:DNA polymerase-3 subunit epsilon